jgi:hypothetical protein
MIDVTMSEVSWLVCILMRSSFKKSRSLVSISMCSCITGMEVCAYFSRGREGGALCVVASWLAPHIIS